jgi:hypothetical protein
MLREYDFYPHVKEFIRKKYNCFYDCIEAGIPLIGSVDVFGVYHKNPEKSEIEVVGAEVKYVKYGALSAISKGFGQTKSYSLFCDRVYFVFYSPCDCRQNKLSEDQIAAAKHLGLGLIELINMNSSFVCNEIIEAPSISPCAKMQDYVLKYKSILQCKSCKTICHSVTTKVSLQHSEWTLNEIRKGKGLLIGETGKEEFYCNKCAKIKYNIV